MLDTTSRLSAQEATAQPSRKRRKIWLQQLHQWHWISSAICLMGMLLFSITGITLNHAGQIEAQPKIIRINDTLPPALLASLLERDGQAQLAAPVTMWLNDRFDERIQNRKLEWSEDELYIAMPRPGGDAWLSIDLTTGELEYERTDRGWISYFNDLHKGRHTGAVWSVFIDAFAAACLVFCITGLLLLQMHSKHRPATWPTVALGLGVMLFSMIVFIH
ncbi:MAG: PepSY-associated TM helix domain-containing protein [Gammaproteobacteria bacterium]|nr:hypothetical protein [Gammaproteobacteria bacterium]